MSGVPVPVISRLLGRSNVRMTLRYAHMADRDIETSAEHIGVAMARILAHEPKGVGGTAGRRRGRSAHQADVSHREKLSHAALQRDNRRVGTIAAAAAHHPSSRSRDAGDARKRYVTPTEMTTALCGRPLNMSGSATASAPIVHTRLVFPPLSVTAIC